MSSDTTDKRPHVVIIGAGFAGLTAAKELGGRPFRVTVIDRTNHHLFQPLLYQVASAGLSPGDIASPIRSILHAHANISVRLDVVLGVDLERKVVRCDDGDVPYDYLILAAGTTNNYFGHPEWERFAPGMKTIDDAIEIRRRVLVSFEAAEREQDDEKVRSMMTMVVIGAGPTGVEMAGSFAELAHYVLDRDFRTIDPEKARVILVEGGDRVLPAFDEEVSQKAVDQLKELGVELRLKARVTNIDARGVTIKAAEGEEFIPALTVVWAAGTKVVPFVENVDSPRDRMGRLIVEKDWSLPKHPEVFCLGDMANYQHDESSKGQPLPGLSPVAMQGARYAVEAIVDSDRGLPRGKFKYWDKGTMATIGRSRAVAQAGALRMSGLLAWLAWLVVHIWYLIGFRTRIVVMLNWFWSYVTYGRGARLITGARLDPGTPMTPSLEPPPPSAAIPAPETKPEPAAAKA